MAFLAPLFLAGLAAIALPVLLHLRQSRPKETVAFSSLMFLEESPPTTKRRSRLQDIILLILRCLALALLILAFARPFFPADDGIPPADGSSLRFILIDTSASMRGELLENAIASAREVIQEIPDGDWIALATFSDKLNILLGPARARELPSGTRKSNVLSLLSEIRADWHPTRLDASLLAAVAAAGEDTPLKIHLIGDWQKGAQLDRLRGEAWPDQFQIIPHAIELKEGWTNAGVHVLPPMKQIQRARVTNAEGSARSDFTLAWSGSEEKTNVSVPPGESAVFEAPPGLPAEGRVTLAGDDNAFDNESWWTTPTRPIASVWYPDPTDPADSTDSAYFVNRAMRETQDYTVDILARLPEEMPALAITSGLLADPSALRRLIESGTTALFTVRDPAAARSLANLLGVRSGEATEAKVADHVRFGEIDFKSSVFAPFADARYSDFSAIRIWKYRLLPPELQANANVLARFDSGDPAWLSFTLGKGTLHVLTTTWRPADSQLALTSKFPPLLHSLLGIPDSELGLRPVGHEGIQSPGIHQIGDQRFSIQLASSESELTPLPAAELRALGLPLDPPPPAAMSQAAAVKLSNIEQESRQRIGWWLLAAAAVFFVAETAWAALATSRQSPVAS